MKLVSNELFQRQTFFIQFIKATTKWWRF